MSTISQSIPNLLSGISQQPDNRKRPGQLRDAINAFPDFALGLLKRPGGKFISNLNGAQTRGNWFSILRDSEEKYIGQYDTTDSIFRIWGLIDGNRRAVSMGANTGQPSACDISDLLTKANAIATAKTNLETANTALRNAAALVATRTAGKVETLNKFFATDFRQLRNPRASDYADKIKEQLTSGVIEIEGTKRQATATVSVSNAITAIGLSSKGSGYETAPTVTIGGSGINATATAELETKGDFKPPINITNAGLAYENSPIATLTGGLAPFCHPKVVLTGPTDDTFDNAGTKTSVASIQLNPGKQIELWNENDPNVLQLGVDSGISSFNFPQRPTLSGTGSGSNAGAWNMRAPETRVIFNGGPGRRVIYLQKQDLTNVHTIRVYGAAANGSNGGLKPETDGNTIAVRQPIPVSLYLEFAENNSTFNPEYNSNGRGDSDLNGPWLNDNYLKFRENRFVLWSSEHAGFTTSSGNPSQRGLFDRNLGEWDEVGVVVPAHTITAAEARYGFKDVTVPARFRKKDIWMTVNQPIYTHGGGAFVSATYNHDHYYVTTMHLLEDMPTGVEDTTITLSTNTIINAPNSEPANSTAHASAAPETAATASITIGKALKSLTLTNAGSGYNEGSPTTIALSGGSFTTAATPTITVTPTFSSVITDAGRGYTSATGTLSGGGGGTGAAVEVTTKLGKVTDISITGGDSGYTANPTIALSAPNLEGAQFAQTIYKKNDVVQTGAVNFLRIANMGQGLAVASATDVATTTTGNGTGLTVDITVTGGQVTAATVNTNGTGYLDGDEITPTGYTGVTLKVGGIKKGTERTDEHPLLASNGYKIYELEEYSAPANTEADLTAAETAYTTALTARNTANTAVTTAQTQYDTAQALCAVPTLPANTLTIKEAGSGLSNGSHTGQATATTGSGTNLTVDIVISGGKVTHAVINNAGSNYAIGDTITLTSFAGVELIFSREPYLRGATADDIEFLTLNDYTFVLNKKKTVAMKPELTHATGFDEHRAQIVINIAANSTDYKVILTQGGSAVTFSVTSASSGASSDVIAGDLATAITANAAYTATQVGASVYITSSAAFSVETRGGGSESSIFALTDTISNVARLPLQSKNGYVVRVVNAEDIDIDDMFVKFTTDGGGNFGTGQWEETAAPGITYKFDELTMPHQLVRDSDGKFSYSTVNWNDRIVGDDNTNPIPSFVNHSISHIFFYRNRMGFLSGQNVVLSRAGDLFNFWNESAQVAVNDDVIDVSAAGKRPVFLNYVQPTAVGLVMYSTTEQFLLSTDSDILAPTSAKVNALSAYECDPNVESVSLGTSQAFVSKTPLYTRLFELNEISSEQPPLMADQTAQIPELIPESINSLVASPALSVVSMGTVGQSTIYQYRFLARTREERLVNSWYKWELTGNLLTQFFDTSTWYGVTALVDRGVKSFDTFATTAAFPADSNSVAITITNATTSLTGSGVTGTATTDASGNITGITITTPGANYSENDAVNITQTGGNGVGTAAVNELHNEVAVQSFDMTQSSEQGFLTLPTGERTDVCLDLFVTNPHVTYDSTKDETSIIVPYNDVTGKTFSVVVLSNFNTVVSGTITGTGSETRTVKIKGDYRGASMVIGFNYDMIIDLPKLYRYNVANNQVTNDDVSSLILHRLKVKTGLSGPVDYRVSITGLNDWTNTVSVTQPNQYQLNNVNMQASSTHVVPIYQRNENLAIRIIGNTPFPVSLLGLDWEGKLNQRFYRRG